MQQIISCAGKAIKSLTAPGMLTLLFFSVIVTILVLIGFVALITVLSGFVSGWLGFSQLGFISRIFGFFSASFIAWILFPGIMPIIVNFYDEKIARTIEIAHYPEAKPEENNPLIPELLHDLKFSLKAILLNILLLPLYFVPMLNLLVFYWLNGFLLGREFFVMVARRYMSVKEAEDLRRKKATVILLGGVMLMVCATIPILNLIAPFWGIALMTHLFHADYKPQESLKALDLQ